MLEHTRDALLVMRETATNEHRATSSSDIDQAPGRFDASPEHALTGTQQFAQGRVSQQTNLMIQRAFEQPGDQCVAVHQIQAAAIQQLETQLGVRLLHRTTRLLWLTPDGELLLDRVCSLLGEVDDINHLFLASQHQVSGWLVIDAPSRLALRVIAAVLRGLLRRHPQLQLILGSTDRAIDLVHEGEDCSIRLGILHERAASS